MFGYRILVLCAALVLGAGTPAVADGGTRTAPALTQLKDTPRDAPAAIKGQDGKDVMRGRIGSGRGYGGSLVRRANPLPNDIEDKPCIAKMGAYGLSVDRV
jgi:hypothetical protein